jgi:endoglucanase
MKELKIVASTLFATLLSSAALAATISNPTANKVIDKNNLTVVITAECRKNLLIKFEATDSVGKKTDLVWAMCTAQSDVWAQINISALKDGNITLRGFQVYRNRTENVYRTIIKRANAIVQPTPTPSPIPSPSPTVKPSPSPTPVPSASPSPTVAPVAGIIYGVNGHDNVQSTYPLSQTEARFKILDARNLRSYRFDLVAGSNTLSTLIPLAKKYNISLRPMLYPTSQSAAYNYVKQYANDIKIWEIGNEQDYSKTGAQDRINAMVATYKGIKQASDELGAGLKTTINIMACNSDDKSADARCPGDKNGAMWFIDMAKASGFNFDYISFHWYPYFGDKGYWMSLYMGQMRAVATKYKVKIMYNEVNCGDVYQGSTDGGRAGDKACYDGVKQVFDLIRAEYTDIVAEINMYEMLDEPDHPVVHERHFGMMYNLTTPKPILDLVTEYANKK